MMKWQPGCPLVDTCDKTFSLETFTLRNQKKHVSEDGLLTGEAKRRFKDLKGNGERLGEARTDYSYTYIYNLNLCQLVVRLLHVDFTQLLMGFRSSWSAIASRHEDTSFKP